MKKRTISVTIFLVILAAAAMTMLPSFMHLFFVAITAVRDEREAHLVCNSEKTLSFRSPENNVYVSEFEEECYENPSNVLYPSRKESTLYLSRKELQSGSVSSAELLMRSHGHIRCWMVADVLHIQVEASDLIWYSKKPKMLSVNTEIVR